MAELDPRSDLFEQTEDDRARNRWAARRAAAAAWAVLPIGEVQALSNAAAEAIAHRRAIRAREDVAAATG